MSEVLAFPSKQILWKYGGYTVKRILLQETNGPCPLLALANLLSLRGSIELKRDDIYLSDEILTLIKEFIIAANQMVSDFSFF